jgi:hypothetical protein
LQARSPEFKLQFHEKKKKKIFVLISFCDGVLEFVPSFWKSRSTQTRFSLGTLEGEGHTKLGSQYYSDSQAGINATLVRQEEPQELLPVLTGFP